MSTLHSIDVRCELIIVDVKPLPAASLVNATGRTRAPVLQLQVRGERLGEVSARAPRRTGDAARDATRATAGADESQRRRRSARPVRGRFRRLRCRARGIVCWTMLSITIHMILFIISAKVSQHPATLPGHCPPRDPAPTPTPPTTMQRPRAPCRAGRGGRQASGARRHWHRR